jgi:predicted DCC family thiol-disulfide oxidoreductase YuxK
MPPNSQTSPHLFVLYDGTCSLCRASVAPVRRLDTDHRIEFLDLHDPSAQQRFPQIDRELAMRWMQAIDARGRISSGIEAWARIGSLLPGWKYLSWILLVPGIRWLAAKVYAWIARNRYRWNREVCSDGTCSLHLPDASSHKK